MHWEKQFVFDQKESWITQCKPHYQKEMNINVGKDRETAYSGVELGSFHCSFTFAKDENYWHKQIHLNIYKRMHTYIH